MAETGFRDSVPEAGRRPRVLNAMSLFSLCFQYDGGIGVKPQYRDGTLTGHPPAALS